MAALSFLGLIAAALQPGDPARIQGPARVQDGDSVAIGGERIRLRGIDAPELRQTCRGAGGPYACGERAREALQSLIGGRDVVCVGGERDRYRRLLALCRAGGTDLARTLVEQGWAVAYGGYEEAEASARAQGAGLWAGEFDRPRDWRVVHGEAADIDADLLGRLWMRLIALFARI